MMGFPSGKSLAAVFKQIICFYSRAVGYVANPVYSNLVGQAWTIAQVNITA